MLLVHGLLVALSDLGALFGHTFKRFIINFLVCRRVVLINLIGFIVLGCCQHERRIILFEVAMGGAPLVSTPFGIAQLRGLRLTLDVVVSELILFVATS